MPTIPSVSWRALLLSAALPIWALACADTLDPNDCTLVECAQGEVCVAGSCRAVSADADMGQRDDVTAEPDLSPEDLAPQDMETQDSPSPSDMTEEPTDSAEDAPPEELPPEDTGPEDMGQPEDMDLDAPPEDLPPEDLPPEDLPPEDTGPEDTGAPDLPPEDVGPADMGPGDMGEEPCALARAEAEPVSLPVDIIWFVDNSGSMSQEEELVEDKINAFARFITRSRIDYRVIMITANDLCVPAPLSGGGCPDTNSERYRHIRQRVESTNGLELVHSTYSQYRDFLRPGAQTHIVAVTDDNARWSASRFLVEMRDLTNPGIHYDFKFHSIVAYGDTPLFGCCGFQGCGAGIGETYLSLSQLTGGVTAQLCNEDWDGIFEDIATNVIEGTLLPCHYEIPEPSDQFEEIDPEEVNVIYSDQGQTSLIPNVDEAADCQGSAWYYDDPDAPSAVILCPDACGFHSGTVEIEFGCDTVKR